MKPNTLAKRQRMETVRLLAAELEPDAAIEACILYLGPLMLDEVGYLLGVTLQRVAQIEKSALRKMRKHLEEKGFEASDVP